MINEFNIDVRKYILIRSNFLLIPKGTLFNLHASDFYLAVNALTNFHVHGRCYHISIILKNHVDSEPIVSDPRLDYWYLVCLDIRAVTATWAMHWQRRSGGS